MKEEVKPYRFETDFKPSIPAVSSEPQTIKLLNYLKLIAERVQKSSNY